ncbi:glycoside hydrolase superfamily [Hyaloraphidium curvatum]|nr:glycoside hydrolase superfamily [Hyaloraphidium curvatum]
MPSATAGTGGAAVPTTTAAAGGTAPTGTASVPPIRPGKFVGVRGTEFVIDGCPFSFAGAGAYYFNYQPPAVIDAALDLAVTSNLRVIRTWAFREEAWLSAAPGGGLRVDNSTTNGVGVLDYGIKAARDRNVRLVMVLTNNWKDFGGCDVWTAAYGGTTHADFYTRTQVKEAFKGYIDIVVNRVNSLTGVAYKDDPTIMAWELMNEPRCQNGGSLGFSATCNAATITAWVAEMSAYLKSRVPNQLVAVGDEGFYNGAGTLPYAYQNNDGVDTEAYLALSSIDFGTFHMYPAPWGSGANEGPWGVDWIRAHGATGLRFGKPMLFEEYGSKDRTQRAGWYASWMAEVEAQPAVAGDLFWMISGGNFPDCWFAPTAERWAADDLGSRQTTGTRSWAPRSRPSLPPTARGCSPAGRASTPPPPRRRPRARRPPARPRLGKRPPPAHAPARGPARRPRPARPRDSRGCSTRRARPTSTARCAWRTSAPPRSTATP